MLLLLINTQTELVEAKGLPSQLLREVAKDPLDSSLYSY
jgi:hypothetical protein